MWRARALRWLSAAGLLGLSACGDSPQPYQPKFGADPPAGRTEYSFAIHPGHNPVLLDATYGPMVAYLNAHIPGATFRLVASRDYAAFERRLAHREFDFALPNPYQGLQARKAGYRIFGKQGDDESFRGLILVRKGSGIDAASDLVGKTISYPASTAVAATMMPQYFLQTHGLPLSRTRTVYVGSQESAIRSVQLGSSDAAATWTIPWELYRREHPAAAATLDVRWTTPHLVNNPLIVRDSVPSALSDHVAALLFSLDESAEGRAILARIPAPGFEPATEATYAPVERFVRDFERKIRPISPPAAQR